MLLPALSKAREKAECISCVSNMKQVGLATAMYTADNKNKLCPLTDWLPNEDTVLLNYLGITAESDDDYCWGVWGSLNHNDVLFCPSNTGSSKNSNLTAPRWFPGYNANYVTGTNRGWISSDRGWDNPSSILKLPSNAAIYVDSQYCYDDGKFRRMQRVTPSMVSEDYLVYHGNSANFTFVDGHVESVQNPSSTSFNEEWIRR